MNIEIIDIKEIKENPNNPRFIRNDKYRELLKSIKELPEMVNIRPIVIDETGVVLGGNMRLKACKEAGYTQVPVIKAENLTEDQKKQFIIKDNQNYGEWDTKLLSDWDKDLLLNSGFEAWEMINIFGINDLGDKYTKKLETSNFNPEEVNVEDYIKQNVFFFNEYMVEFEDEEIKKNIINLKGSSLQDAFIDDLKKLIKKYGENSI